MKEDSEEKKDMVRSSSRKETRKDKFIKRMQTVAENNKELIA